MKKLGSFLSIMQIFLLNITSVLLILFIFRMSFILQIVLVILYLFTLSRINSRTYFSRKRLIISLAYVVILLITLKYFEAKGVELILLSMLTYISLFTYLPLHAQLVNCMHSIYRAQNHIKLSVFECEIDQKNIETSSLFPLNNKEYLLLKNVSLLVHTHSKSSENIMNQSIETKQFELFIF